METVIETSSESNEEVVKAPKRGKKEKDVEPVKDIKVTTIYVGPNVPGGVLSKYTTFRGELPKYIQKFAERYEGLLSLIVPISDQRATEKLVNQIGTSQHMAYQNILRGGKK